MNRMFVSILVLLCAAAIATAMPPRPGLKEPASLSIMRARGMDSPSDGLVQQQGAKGNAISGSRSYPVVMGYFTDLASTNTQAEFQAMLFGSAANAKSVNNFYRDMSYSAMSCSGAVDTWRNSNNTVAYYGGGNYGQTSGTTGNVYEFIRKVLAHADSFVDFSSAAYDQNSDGYVDVLWVVHSGKGAEETGSTNDIWSHSFQLSSWGGGATYYTTNDAWPGHAGQYVKINKYIIMPERTAYANGSPYNNSIIGCGVFCHEFGHALGLPDLYDVALASNGIEGQGLGNFSVMAGGSWGGNGSSNARPVALDAWSRRYLGWLMPTLVTSDGFYTVNASMTTASGGSYKLARLGRDTTKQFWLVENRLKNAQGTFSSVRWDSLLYGQGLLIYHIDTTYTSGTYWSTNHVNSNSTNGTTRNRPYGVALEETDQIAAGYYSDLWNSTNYGEAADAWNSGTQANFDSVGTAYPVTYLNGTDSLTGGAHTGTAVRKIPAAAAAMACSMFVSVPAGVEQGPAAAPAPRAFGLGTAYPNPAAAAATFSYQLPQAAAVRVEIFNLAGHLLQRAECGVQPAGRHAFTWRAGAAPDGVYLYRVTAGGKSAVGRMTVVR